MLLTLSESAPHGQGKEKVYACALKLGWGTGSRQKFWGK